MYKQTQTSHGGSTETWYVQQYNALGQSQGRSISVVHPNLINGQGSVGIDGNGNFVVAWDDYSNGNIISAQRYSSSGRAVGARIQVNTTIDLVDWQSSIGVSPSGSFVVTWAARFPNNQGSQQEFQAFNADGTRNGSIVTFTSTSAEEYPASIAMQANGDFILAWDVLTPSRMGQAYVQRFDANGVAKEAAIPVDSAMTGDQEAPSVAVDGNGNFTVVWNNPVIQNFPLSLTDCDVYGQRFVLA
jgi:hypothetical protein